MTEYVTLTKQHAQSLLVEIAELRSQVSYLTDARDRALSQRCDNEERYHALYAEHQDTLSDLTKLQGEIEGLKAQLEARGVSVE